MVDKKIISTPAERKAKRELRREKQRQANIGRAKKMHRARIETTRDLFAVDIKIENDKTQLYVGCSGWFYWDWRGKFYPEDMPTKEWFNHYASRFKTVELNAPFYSWPTVNTVKTWLKQIGRKRFVYTVKVCELITHIKRFVGTKELVKDFGYIADMLGTHMGCFLFQLPPSYNYTPARLKAIVSQLDPERRNVVEFRHVSWWNEKVYTEFEKNNIIFCSCSAPKLPDELIKTADDIYIRFHGTERWYRHNYSKEELAVWAKRIRASRAKRVWVYFNNDWDCYAISNARELLRQLKQE